MNKDYKKQEEPQYRERSYNWKTAIGLQQVDGLVPSRYLIEAANDNISGKLSLEEVEQHIAEYYEQKPSSSAEEKRTEEADKVATQIAIILASRTFKLAPAELIAIHRQMFHGVFEHAGKIRDCNLAKKEWVLADESVIYCDFRAARESIEDDFEREKAFDYSKLNERQTIGHIAKFIADLWQVHVFMEGNTRTIAVFTIKYLRTFGYDVTNDTFEKHSWYFRNALVRANYNNYKIGVKATQIYLDHFFGNLLLNEHNELQNRNMSILQLIHG
jgi:fido (protein-threonine AMPylation protein)